jgi:thioesterase domain-containing protein
MAAATAADVRARTLRDVDLEPMPGPPNAPLRSLIPMKTSGTARPVFVIHGGFGQVFLFKRLAERLRDDIPFYALESHGLRDEAQPHASIEDMASAYIDEIRTVQPSGPYLIGGFSLGVYIAWEIGHQLERHGEDARLLLIDAGPPLDQVQLGRPYRLRRMSRIARFHWRNWRSLEGQPRAAYRREAVREEIARLLGFFHLGNTRLADRFARRAGRSTMPGQRAVHRANIDAMERWDFEPYPHEVTLFRARIQGPLSSNHPTLGFTPELTPGGIDIRHLPGSHAFMFVEPHVNTLTAEFEAWYDRQVAALPDSRVAATVAPPATGG